MASAQRRRPAKKEAKPEQERPPAPAPQSAAPKLETEPQRPKRDPPLPLRVYVFVVLRLIAILVVFTLLHRYMRRAFHKPREVAEMEQIIAQLCPNGIHDCPYGTQPMRWFEALTYVQISQNFECLSRRMTGNSPVSVSVSLTHTYTLTATWIFIFSYKKTAYVSSRIRAR